MIITVLILMRTNVTAIAALLATGAGLLSNPRFVERSEGVERGTREANGSSARNAVAREEQSRVYFASSPLNRGKHRPDCSWEGTMRRELQAELV